MRLLLLTRSETAPGNRRLAQAARARGLEVLVVDPLAVRLGLGPRAEVRLDDGTGSGTELGATDLVLARFGPELQATGLAVLRALEARGARALDGAAGVARARDKAGLLLALGAAGLDMPATALVTDPAQADWAVEAVGGPPVIVKPARGWLGRGVELHEQAPAAVAALRERADARCPLLVQPFVAGPDVRELRVLVLDGRILGAARKRAADGDFRANAAQGGSAEATSLTAVEEGLALAAAAGAGLRLAGVDLFATPAGPLLLEVNAAPGFVQVEAVTEVDVAGAVVTALSHGPSS